MMRRYSRISPIVWSVVAGCVLLLGVRTESSAGTDTITQSTRETIDATKKYTAQQKEAFQQKAQEELIAVQRHIAVLRDKSREASIAARADLQASIDELERKKEAAKERLATLRNATDEKWNAVKSGVDTALDEINNSYRKALSHLP